MRLVSTPSPDDTATEHEPDPTSLRIVRLRLALALIAAAILPLAVGAPVLRVLLDDTQATATDRLSDAAADVAGAMTVQLEGTRRALGLIAASDPAPGAAAGDEDARAALARAVAQLREGSTFVTEVWALGPDGSTAFNLDPQPADVPAPALSATQLARALALPPGEIQVLDPGSSGAELLVLTAVPGKDGAAGLLAASLSLERLVRLAASEAGNGEWSVAVRPAGGEPIAVLDRPDMDVGRLPGEVLGRALDPAQGLEAAAEDTLDAVGFTGWTVVLHAPFAVSSVPLAPLGLLVLISLALVGLIGWMAAQVLRPAAELDASRRRLRELYSMEREASLRDHLTGLGNHRAFQEELARQFDQTGRYHVPMSVVLLDLDEFKQVNDTLGHAVGDDLLAEVGRVIRSTIRAADRAFRTGGDEFAIVLPHTDASGGMDLANRLLRRLLEDRPSGRYQRPISFSGGVAAAPEHAGDRMQLLARADAALYRSKRNGRTMVTLFDAEIDRPALSEQERAALSARVTRVASSRSLTAVYQPIVHVETGRPIAYEGLVRPAPDSGFESPAALFAAAEVSGRIIDLDRACLDVVVAGARQAPEDVYLSLNVSPRTFEAPEFSANAFLSILHRHGVPPRRVILELTERETIEDVDRLRVALESCRRAGVQIAADDVGAGNAGIRLLSQIQFDVIKIDLSLVQAGSGREPVGSVLSSLVDLARRWRALVVAEGVETPEQLRMIKALGIDAAQGYLLGRPGPLVPSATFDLDALSAEAPQAWWLASRAASTPLAS